MVEYEEDYFTRTVYKPYQDFPRHTRVVERFVRIMRPRSVLDVGCAYGYIILQVMAEFERVAHRRYLGLAYNAGEGTEAHICNHGVDWWFGIIPAQTYLTLTGKSLDLEEQWLYKD